MEETITKALIVYLSRRGHTKHVAEAISTDPGADIEPIKDFKKRIGILEYLKSVREAVFRQFVPIQEDSLQTIQLLLRHIKLEGTVRYMVIVGDDAIETAE